VIAKIGIIFSLIGLICGAILATICCFDKSQSLTQLLFGIFLIILNSFLLKFHISNKDLN
jgi:hypothetical protein